MEDVLEIWEHIADDSIRQADAWVDRLDEALQLLSTQPRMGRERNELAAGVRSFPFGAYVIFYRLLPDGVDIVRVLHGSRDVESALKDAGVDDA